MRDDDGFDESRHRARSGRQERSSDRVGSSRRRPSRDSDSRHRHRSPRNNSSRRHHRDSKGHRASHKEHRDEPSKARYPEEKGDLIPRYQEQKEKERTADTAPTAPDSASRGRQAERRQSPPSSIKSSRTRHGSRTPSPSENPSKRSRKRHSTSHRDKDRSQERSSKRHRRSSVDRKKSSHQSRHQTSPERSNRSRRRSDSHSRRRSRSRSPTPSRIDPRKLDRTERSRHRSRSRSSTQRSSHHHRHRSPREDRSQLPPTGPSSTDIDRYSFGRRGRSPAVGGSGVDHHVSRSRDHSPPTSRRDRRDRDDDLTPSHPVGADLEDAMAARGSYRAGHRPSYAHQPSYASDLRGYSQSPRHGSYHTSPAHSSYGGGRAGWNGPPHSPPPQYHPSYHQGPQVDYPPSHGPPPRDYHQPHSPPYAAPTGPSMSQYPQGPYRGGPRGGGPGGPRGGAFSGRAGHRNSNFKTAQWNSHQGPSRGFEDESLGRMVENEQAPARDDGIPRGPKVQDDSSGPPSQAPSGPAAQTGGTKFSFAFKASSKVSATGPNPEISQKLNVAPKRPAPSAADREPPNNAPTEPASARHRDEGRQPPSGPRLAPRMRKVKKIMKRPKPRPQLPTELIESESVYYRKPGNESVIGSGTYGKVFKGLNVYTKGLVALKRIRMEGERDGFPVTAVREIKLLQSLRHINIVNLQEVMVEKNDCFMVFEYLSHDLTGLLHHPSFKLDPAQKKHLAQQLCQGLDYLHSRGVLHRDIKAANILVSNEGILKLADFGLARFYAKRHQLDYTNRVITIWYRSPELLLGETQYTAAVDVWSAACVLMEIFSKNAIFAGDGTELSQMEKIYSVLGTPNKQDWPGLVDMAWFELLRPSARRKSVFADKYRDHLTPAAFDLLTEMFSYDPTKRPTAAQALQHRYFTEEQPLPKQARELSDIDGDWHEHESKALRKEKERVEREARKAKEAANGSSSSASATKQLTTAANETHTTADRKRPIDTTAISSDGQRDTKRVALESAQSSGDRAGSRDS